LNALGTKEVLQGGALRRPFGKNSALAPSLPSRVLLARSSPTSSPKTTNIQVAPPISFGMVSVFGGGGGGGGGMVSPPSFRGSARSNWPRSKKTKTARGWINGFYQEYRYWSALLCCGLRSLQPRLGWPCWISRSLPCLNLFQRGQGGGGGFTHARFEQQVGGTTWSAGSCSASCGARRGFVTDARHVP